MDELSQKQCYATIDADWGCQSKIEQADLAE